MTCRSFAQIKSLQESTSTFKLRESIFIHSHPLNLFHFHPFNSLSSVFTHSHPFSSISYHINQFIITTGEKEGKEKIVPNHWIQKILHAAANLNLASFLPPPCLLLESFFVKLRKKLRKN